MTREEAEKYADNMTYRDAIYNLMQARAIPYRKATFIKVNELLKALEQEPKTGRLYNDIYDHYLCGNCKMIVMDYDNFCPNCGCRMQESEDEE